MNDVWQRGRHIAYVDREGRSALINLSRTSEMPLVLEGSAAEVWQRIDGVRPVDDVIAELMTIYDEPESTIRPAVESFVADLARRDLIIKVHP